MSYATTKRSIQYGSKTQVLDSGNLPDTPLETIDAYLKVLKSKQMEWAQTVSIPVRIALLEKSLINLDVYKDEWATQDMEARHVPQGHWEEGNSYLNPGTAGRILRMLIDSLKDLEAKGITTSHMKAEQDGDRVTLHAYPQGLKDSLYFPGIKTEVHLEKGTKLENLKSYEAIAYHDPHYSGAVCLVLGAGNASFLSFADVMHKLIVDKKVVILKTHPVLEYTADLFEKILEPFIASGYLRIVRGGAKEGKHLTSHPSVDEIHMTGSDKTFDAIVYGTGEEGQKNKLTDTRITNKTVIGELGNVSPLIVVPGDWKESEFDYQADNVMSMLGILNGYACNATRVIILPKNWSGSEKLIKKISEKMQEAQAPVNYYPGTTQTIEEAMVCYPNMETHGKLDESHQPWMFVKNLDPDKPEYAFRREFWSSFTSQVFIEADSTEEYLEKAVKFANEKLWGTLSATLIIDPKTEKELTQKKILQKAIDDLNYGTVALNVNSAFGLLLGSTPWGGHPGSTYSNIQSGNGFVSNAFMLDKVEKSVIRAPFHITPRPAWFITGKPNLKASKAIANFAISNKLMDFGRVLMSVLRG